KCISQSYWVFVVQYFVEFIWLLAFKDNYSLWEINNFSSLSLLSIVTVEKAPLYLLYPLSAFNLWELAFITLICSTLIRHAGIAINKILLVLFCAYILPLLCWIAIVCYINMLNTL
ncbi:MAG: hypothetical protein LBL90_02980, partial [Prevotellaceae bacterium]|nr:hypothetical protein [Prevotellaceae bacterium]